MKRVILADKNQEKEIMICDVSNEDTVFAYERGEVCGMVVYYPESGYILRLSPSLGATGFHKTIQDLIEYTAIRGYDFYVV